MIGDGDVTRLPKWAQERIRLLEQTIVHQTSKIDELTSAHPGSNIRMPGYHDYPDTTLPANSQVEFYLGATRERHEDMISVRHANQKYSPGALEFSACRGLIAITPVAGNVVRVKIEGF